MATQIYSKKNPTSDNDDPDILIGKLVTAELKKTPESRKNILKKKFMDILYNCDTTWTCNFKYYNKYFMKNLKVIY